MKVDRHTKILEIIENNAIETQEELASKLKEEGVDVTQATISRDIREMKLTKISMENGKQKYTAIKNSDTGISDRLIRIFKDAVIKVDYSQNMIVIKTHSGMGMAVAVAVDNIQSNDILGSIAGDDTVFCVARTHNQAVEFIHQLNKIMSAD